MRVNCSVITVRHRFNIYASNCNALALCGGMDTAKLITRFGVIRRREYNEKFGLVYIRL